MIIKSIQNTITDKMLPKNTNFYLPLLLGKKLLKLTKTAVFAAKT